MNKPMNEKEDCITMVTVFRRICRFLRIRGNQDPWKDYLLVTDAPEDEDGECYILKDVSGENDSEALFEFVEDDRELDGVMGIFEELLKDADVELEK